MWLNSLSTSAVCIFIFIEVNLFTKTYVYYVYYSNNTIQIHILILWIDGFCTKFQFQLSLLPLLQLWLSHGTFSQNTHRIVPVWETSMTSPKHMCLNEASFGEPSDVSPGEARHQNITPLYSLCWSVCSSRTSLCTPDSQNVEICYIKM